MLKVTETEFKAIGSKIAYRVRVKNSSDIARTARVRAQFVDKQGFMLGFSFADERTIEPGAGTWFSETTIVQDGDSTAVAAVEARVIELN
ncbi:MAG: hypothetical protein IPH13_01180 [Planctomycetes bacterium]|nr:hypothetical protein [Planctomycetota bacterium]